MIDSNNIRRGYRPVEHKIVDQKYQGNAVSMIGLNRKVNYPHYQANNRGALDHNADFQTKKYDQVPEQYYERKSDLNREFVFGRDEGRASDFTAIHQPKKNKLNYLEKSNQEASSH